MKKREELIKLGYMNEWGPTQKWFVEMLDMMKRIQNKLDEILQQSSLDKNSQ